MPEHVAGGAFERHLGIVGWAPAHDEGERLNRASRFKRGSMRPLWHAATCRRRRVSDWGRLAKRCASRAERLYQRTDKPALARQNPSRAKSALLISSRSLISNRLSPTSRFS